MAIMHSLGNICLVCDATGTGTGTDASSTSLSLNDVTGAGVSIT